MQIDQIIKEAVICFNEGGIVIFPTDTAFGIGCRLDKPESINKLFRIRNRPLTQATPVLVFGPDMALNYYQNPSETVNKLMKKYWPGALTIVSLCNTELITPLVRGSGNTIGMRMPNSPIILEIIKKIGVPVLGPSANFHNCPTPFNYRDLDRELIKLADYVVPGECTVGKVSTVVECIDENYKILRQGAITLENLV
jgi:L-threonylcarbamoyladenylate synthase